MNEIAIRYVENQLKNAYYSLTEYTQNNFGTQYKSRNIFIKISKYVQDFIMGVSSERWIIMPGLRGVGKTTILAQIFLKLFNSETDKNLILYISMDYAVSVLGLSLVDILSAYEKIIGVKFDHLDKRIFIFIDEVQSDPNWSIVLKSYIYDKSKNIFLLITGSSALSLQTSADVSRRASFEKMYPMNFCEYQLIKNHKFPISNLKNKIRDAIYFSENAHDVCEKLKKLESEYEKYWSSIDLSDVDDYIKLGTFPFAINKPEEKMYEKINLLLDKVITTDISQMGTFDLKTLNSVKRLLFLFADNGDVISLQNLSNTLGLDRLTISALLDALVNAEVLIKILPHGSNTKKITKPSRYHFMSPSYRMALLNISGNEGTHKTRQGRLIEDIVASYMYREIVCRGEGTLTYDAQQGGADFVADIRNKSKVVIEIGMGVKNGRQIKQTMKKVNGTYGICISFSNTLITCNDDIVNMPLKLFLLS